MGYVDGVSLAERIARNGPMSPDDVVALLDQLAAALGAAHAHGVVHRDVKAENVLLDAATGRAMVTDFGIARVTETQAADGDRYRARTVHYMSPEQVSGDALDGRSDLYSLGIVLAFFALTGRFPFERSTASARRCRARERSCPSCVITGGDTCRLCLMPLWRSCCRSRRMIDTPMPTRFAPCCHHPTSTVHRIQEFREVGVPGTNTTAPALLSSAEAAEVWSRAADLQATPAC